MNYFDHPAISQSKLKDFKRSPKHYWTKYLDHNRILEEETPAMKFGKAVHMAVFEPERFAFEYKVLPSVDKRTKEGKLILKDLEEANPNAIFICREESDQIINIHANLYQKNASKFFLNNQSAVAEHEIFWLDQDTRLECKAKLDLFIPPSEYNPYGLVIDLKTTIDAREKSFSKSIHNFGYYNQAAWYCEAVKQFYRLSDHPTFIIIAIEKSAPYECGFYAVDEGMLEMGLLENRRLLNQLAECQKNNAWPGYKDEIVPIALPHYAMQQFEFDEEFI